MPEFFNVLPPAEALKLLLSHLPGRLPVERLSIQDALDRVSANALTAPEALPAFRRSAMDGYALRAADSFGASAGLPALFQVVSEAMMGQPADQPLAQGQAVLVHTGGMIPPQADAVVQVEHTQIAGRPPLAPPFDIEVFQAVAPGQNVLQPGEDIQAGQEIFAAGHRLRPQDIGGLVALGVTAVEVVRRPRVAIISSGDELVAPEQQPGRGQIRDVNTATLAALTVRAGGRPAPVGIVADDFEALLAIARAALETADVLLLSAGSSVSARDMTAAVIEQLGEPGILLHGIATRPGKPTILGVAGGKPVLGLPGNPVSAVIQFMVVAAPLLDHLQGLLKPSSRGIVWARLAQNVASEAGREDYVPVRVSAGADGLLAEPVFGKSNYIFSLVQADGLLQVPLNKGGLAAGEWVELSLF
ncbi:MAG: molybdopterin molybdotransferase MoeA [Candidatus Promineifilaceae bacterium]